MRFSGKTTMEVAYHIQTRIATTEKLHNLSIEKKVEAPAAGTLPLGLSWQAIRILCDMFSLMKMADLVIPIRLISV
jgi:hypothetical protein